jgi:hypothetical protein
VPVFIMFFDVVPDVLEIAEDLTAWAKEEIFGDHVPLWLWSGPAGPWSAIATAHASCSSARIIGR